MSSHSRQTAESLISEGRDHYAAKRFKPALEQFTRAMKLCPCYRGMKRDRCSCKNYEQVVMERGSIFHEAMYKCRCTVGKTFNKCENEQHIRALDYRAATFEALQELERARRDAEWILELAPRLPDGYLRLGKIARLQKKHMLAWNIYTAGIEVGKDGKLAASSKFQKLYAARKPLHVRFSHRDPLRNPFEIVQRIFSSLDMTSCLRCLRVSKEWHEYLTSPGNAWMWKSLLFTTSQAPSTDALRRLVSYSGKNIRRLEIENAHGFKLNQSKFLALLQGSRNLEYLGIKGHSYSQVMIPPDSGVLNNLTHVSFDEFIVQMPHVLRTLLEQCQTQIQYLKLRGLPRAALSADLPDMPNLKFLRLEAYSWNDHERLDIFRIAPGTPKLQQLHLREMQLGTTGQTGNLWSDLKVLAVSHTTDPDIETTTAIAALSSLRQGTGFQHINLDFRAKHLEQGNGGIFGFDDNDDAPINTPEGCPINYCNLRSLHLERSLIPPHKLRSLVAESLTTGKLHTLDIVFPLEALGSALGASSTDLLGRYGWLRGEPSIRCFGLCDFRFKSYYRSDSDMPLITFLASFPNLEVLEISSAHYEVNELCTLIEAILRATKLEKVYSKSLYGMPLTKLQAVAKRHNVELIAGGRPQEWPLSTNIDIEP